MNGSSARSSLVVAFFLLLICLAGLLAYYPGLHGPFVFDDTVNIVDNPRLALARFDAESLLNAAFSSDSGILRRPLATTTFALNWYFAGGVSNTRPFKLTNLVIHLANAGLIYWLTSLLMTVRQQARRKLAVRHHFWIPGLVAAIWALHPIHLTSVLYVVQRMTSLSALFVLLGLIVYLHGRLRLDSGRPRALLLMSAGLATGLVLGLASKENAVLLPFLALVIEFVFFERRGLASPDRRKLAWFYTAWVLVPLVAAVAWLMLHPDFLAATYTAREFTPRQRLLTEARILWFYAGLLLIPDIGKFGLFHDDIAISTGLLSPWTTLPALIGLAAVLGLALTGRIRSRYPLFSFAVLWFLVGHGLESGVIGLELAHEHRNYLPSLGPLLGGVYGITALLTHQGRQRAATAVLLVLAAVFAGVTHLRAQSWRSEAELIQSMVVHHPRSARSHAMLAELLAKRFGDIHASLAHYQTASTLAPWETSYLIRTALVAASAAPDNADHPATRDLLNPALVNTINDNLAQRPLTASTAADLRTLATCIPDGVPACARIYPYTVGWYRAVVANPHVGVELRHSVLIYLFNIAAWRKDHAVSLEAARLGRQHYPDDADFVLMEANAHMLSGRLDEAWAILASVERTAQDPRGDLREKIEALRSLLQQSPRQQAR